MGRTVETPHNALFKAFIAHSSASQEEGEDFDFDEFFFEEWEENAREKIIERFPSFYEPARRDSFLEYPYRETRVLLRNGLLQVTFSHYCGLSCLALVPIDDDYRDISGLVGRFAEQVSPWFEENFGDLQKIGTFSNGEAVYSR